MYDSIRMNVLSYVSPHLEKALKNLNFDGVTEIRVGKNMPLCAIVDSRAFFIGKKGELLKSYQNAYIATEEDFSSTLELMTAASIYAATDELKNGFLTLPGGFRVGVCGRAVLNGKKVSYIKEISYLNIRIAREIFDCAKKLSNLILADGSVKSTLIIGPPGSGKTTLIRDLARILSDDYSVRCAIADERGEIAAMHRGTAICDVGKLTCVMDLCPKKYAVNMLVRSMSPEVIITDELGDNDDLYTVKKAMHCGVKVIATIHGDKVSDAGAFAKKFDCIAILSRQSIGKIQKFIKNGDKNG